MLELIWSFAFMVCIKAEPNPRLIVGGTSISLDTTYQYQHQVSIAHFDTNILGKIRSTNHFCGGSVISTQWILTAAHCVEKETANSLVVRVGSFQRDKGGVLLRLSRIVSHPRYNHDSLDFDVALLKVRRNITLGDTVKIICLPDPRSKVVPLGRALVTGWGYKQENGYSARKLRAAYVRLKPPEVCQERYGQSFTDNMICAGGGRKDSCQGDSGGPLVLNEVQIGIVSWGFGCGRQNQPGVYTSVSAVRDWIFNQTSV